MKWVEDLRRLLRRLGRQPPSAEAPGAMQCHEALERIFDWLDSELDAAEAARVGEHLETCARCYPVLNFERSFREAVDRARHVEATPPDLEGRILHVLEEQGFGAS